MSPSRWRSAGSAASRATAATHSSVVVAGKPVSLRANHLDMNPHRVGDHRQSGRLILKDLQPALAAAPRVIGHPADADVRRRDLGRLGLFAPDALIHRQIGNRQEPVADELEPCSRNSTPDGRERLREPFQSAQRALRSDPDQLERGRPGGRRVRRPRSRKGILCWLHAGRDDVDAKSRRVFGGLIGEVIVPRDDEIARLRRSPESAAARLGSSKPARRVGIAEPDGVVEVEDQLANAAAEQCHHPARQELALNDHGIGFGKPATDGQAAEGGAAELSRMSR